jgi:hypothetical protein
MRSMVDAQIIPPSTLADRVNNEHRQLKECLVRGAHHAIKAGELLWEAKRQAGHGGWLEWIATNCEFSERTAQLYMKLATTLPGMANPQRIADMSLTGAIKMIEDLKSPEENPIPKARSIKRADKLTEAIKNGPLAILQRAWDEAGESERLLFRKQIGA